MVRILVVGASGLIGGRLLAALHEEPSATLRAASRTARSWPAGIEGVQLADEGNVDAACAGVDVIVNLASMPEAECAADPAAALRVNAGGTLMLVRAAMRAAVTRFVQLSTFKVYGNSPSGVITEESTPRPSTHYAITHRASEDYADMHPRAVIVRLANGFGAPETAVPASWSLIANEFCRQAVVNRRIEIRSDGRAQRCFVPLDDIVTALRAAIGILPAGTYNLGAPASLSLREMAERVAEVCEETLGFRPSLSIGTEPSGPNGQALEFRSSRLAAEGVLLSANVKQELVRTLHAAASTFGSTADA